LFNGTSNGTTLGWIANAINHLFGDSREEFFANRDLYELTKICQHIQKVNTGILNLQQMEKSTNTTWHHILSKIGSVCVYFPQWHEAYSNRAKPEGKTLKNILRKNQQN